MQLRRPSKKLRVMPANEDAGSFAMALQHFVVAADHAGFRLDPRQLEAATHLAALANAVSTGGDASSLYLWGPVGRGKTWLVDVFVGALPDGWARRFHFHSFWSGFHDALGAHGRGAGAVSGALDAAVGDARIVCFDEFFAHEPGDAQLLTVLLRELRERRRLPMVVTSNYPPDGLMPDAEFVTTGEGSWDPVVVRHQSFEDGIALIKRHFEVIAVDGGVDYRTVSSPGGAGFGSGAYVVGRVDVGDASSAVLHLAGGRVVRAHAVHEREITFTFRDLCEQPVSAGDVARLTHRYKVWTLLDVPPLSACTPEAAQRFVNVLDVLYDADVALTITSAVPPSELATGRWLPPDVARAISRIAVLPRRQAKA